MLEHSPSLLAPSCAACVVLLYNLFPASSSSSSSSSTSSSCYSFSLSLLFVISLRLRSFFAWLSFLLFLFSSDYCVTPLLGTFRRFSPLEREKTFSPTGKMLALVADDCPFTLIECHLIS